MALSNALGGDGSIRIGGARGAIHETLEAFRYVRNALSVPLRRKRCPGEGGWMELSCFGPKWPWRMQRLKFKLRKLPLVHDLDRFPLFNPMNDSRTFGRATLDYVRIAALAASAAALFPAWSLGQAANPPSSAAADASGVAAPSPSIPVDDRADKTDSERDKAVVLSPFEVKSDQSRGYFTPNTVSGTRLNNNIGDMPSSITVIDKQQLEDTNSLNINDVMLYEANTEGSHTYTPVTGFTQSGGHMVDALNGANDGATSNGIGGAQSLSTRVRGLGAPDNEVDNFPSIYRIPFDSYNVQSIEIDRGPNSLMFGSGSAAGIVNASSTQAQINKLSGETSLQAGSYGELRETAGLNIPLWKDKAALYVAQEGSKIGFQRKPSSDLTAREFAAITIEPFKNHKTKITASAEFWNNYANDENNLTPYDYVTPWLQAGKPVYNALTDTVTYLATGKTLGPYVSSSTSPLYVPGQLTGTSQLTTLTSPLFAPGIAFTSNHITEFYSGGQFLYAYQPAQTIGNNGVNGGQAPTVYTPAGQIVSQSMMTNSTNLPIPAGYASNEQPGVNNSAIYDYNHGPNTLANDFNRSKARTYHIEIQQEILPNLNADIAFFRQEFHDVEDQMMNQHNPLGIMVDTNAVLLSGQPNPYVGTSYYGDTLGSVWERAETNQNYRAMLEYSLDLRDKVPRWLKWLGHHRFMAEASSHDDVQYQWRFQTVINGGDGSFNSNLYQLNTTPAVPGNYSIGGNSVAPQLFYYAGAPGALKITQAPSPRGSAGFGGMPANFNVTTYNYAQAQWQTTGLKQDTVQTYLNTPFFEGIQNQKTYFWQSFFWDERIVGSLGLNDDIVKNRTTAVPPNSSFGNTSNNPGLVEYTNGIINPNYKYYVTPWNPVTVNGQLTTQGELGGNTFSTGFVSKPFIHWSAIDRAANRGNWAAAFLRTLGFSFNRSDNFNPPAAAYTDLFGNPLPKPTGTETDYGLQVATPDNRLFLRVNWFRSKNQFNTSGVSETITGRIPGIEQGLIAYATTLVELRNGQDPTNVNFGDVKVFPLTQNEISEIQAIAGVPYDYSLTKSPSGGYYDPQATNTVTAGGYDVELTYNPTPNWTMKITGGRQDAKLSSVDSQATAYIAARMPYWQKVVAADYPTPIPNYKGGGPSSLLYVGSFLGNYSGSNATNGPGGTPTTYLIGQQNSVFIPLQVELASQGTQVPGQRPYSATYLTNYMMTRGPLKGLGIGGSARWTSKAIEGYYGATAPALLNSAGLIAASDLNRPIYAPAETHLDAWLSYSIRLPWDNGKIRTKFQFNVQDLTSHGYLLPIQYNLDGSAATYRIISPRTYTFTTRFFF
jgi:hypothetical protein